MTKAPTWRESSLCCFGVSYLVLLLGSSKEAQDGLFKRQKLDNWPPIVERVATYKARFFEGMGIMPTRTNVVSSCW